MKKIISSLLCIVMLATLVFSANVAMASSAMPVPVTYLSFDGNANDSVGTSNGTVFGNAMYDTSFDGTKALHVENAFGKTASQYLSVPAEVGGSDFTISFWYQATGSGGFSGWTNSLPRTNKISKPAESIWTDWSGFDAYAQTYKNGGAIFSTADTAVVSKGIALFNLPSKIDGALLVSNGTNTVSKNGITSYQDTRWHNVTMSVAISGNAVLYVDGINVATLDVSALGGFVNSGRITLGADVNGQYGVGSANFDNLAIFNSALSQAEVSSFIARDMLKYEIKLVEKTLLENQGSRFTTAQLGNMSDALTKAKAVAADDAGNWAAEYTLLKNTFADFLAGDYNAIVTLAADTHFYSTESEAWTAGQYNKYAINHMKKAVELGSTTYIHAGDHNDKRDHFDDSSYFRVLEENFFKDSSGNLREGVKTALVLGNHQFTHAYDASSPNETASFIEECNAYIDASLEPNKAVTENGKLVKTYYYIEDDSAHYIAMDNFEGCELSVDKISITDEQWQWVYSTIEYCNKKDNKPVFLITHYPNYTHIWGTNYDYIRDTYKNVYHISGDLHTGMGATGITGNTNPLDLSKRLPEINLPTTLGARGSDALCRTPTAYFMYMYDDCFVLRAYNIATDEWMPEFDETVYYDFYIDTEEPFVKEASTATPISGLAGASSASYYSYPATLQNKNLPQPLIDSEIYAVKNRLDVSYQTGMFKYADGIAGSAYDIELSSNGNSSTAGFYKLDYLSDGLIPSRYWDTTNKKNVTAGSTGYRTVDATFPKDYFGQDGYPMGVVLAELDNGISEIESLLIGSGSTYDSALGTRKYDVYISNSMRDLYEDYNKVLSFNNGGTTQLNVAEPAWYHDVNTGEYTTDATGNHKYNNWGDAQYITFTGNELPAGKYIAIVVHDAGKTGVERLELSEFAVFGKSTNPYYSVTFKGAADEIVYRAFIEKGKTIAEALGEEKITAITEAIPDVAGSTVGKDIGGETYYWNKSLDTAVYEDMVIYALYTENEIMGVINENVNWSYDAETGTLSIFGTGTFAANYNNVLPPWGTRVDGDSILRVVIGEGITEIPLYCFASKTITSTDGTQTNYSTPNIEEVSFPSTLTKIGNFAFNNLTKLSSVNFAEPKAGVSLNIADAAFAKCTALMDFTIPQNTVAIGAQAFGAYISATSTNEKYNMVIPGSVTALGAIAMNQRYYIKGLIFEDSDNELTLGANTFLNQEYSFVVLPERIKIATDTAIGGKFVELKLNADTIVVGTKGSDAETYAAANGNKFVEIPADTKIVDAGTDSPIFWIYTDKDELIFLGEGRHNGAYWGTAPSWEKYSNTVKKLVFTDGITAVPQYILKDNIGAANYARGINLEEITLASTVKSVDFGAFNNCPKLKVINFAEGLESIGDQVFLACPAIETLDFPASLKSIGAQAFSASAWDKPTQFTRITFAEGSVLETIGNYAFRWNDKLEYVSPLPASLKTLGTNAFSRGTSSKLKEIVFEGSLPTFTAATSIDQIFDKRAGLTIYYPSYATDSWKTVINNNAEITLKEKEYDFSIDVNGDSVSVNYAYYKPQAVNGYMFVAAYDGDGRFIGCSEDIQTSIAAATNAPVKGSVKDALTTTGMSPAYFKAYIFDGFNTLKPLVEDVDSRN